MELSKSDTPRTDALARETMKTSQQARRLIMWMIHAKKLERELISALKPDLP